jgi:hypothetical protein
VSRVQVRLHDAPSIIDIISHARKGPGRRDHFSVAQLEQISRTVRRAPEVMVKVTGGGRSTGAVAAHFAYISGKGRIGIGTDDGHEIDKAGQKDLLKSWHLDLTAGQYRTSNDGSPPARRVKLVHNIVLSMPSPTPAAKVQRAAAAFARENFGAKHPYAMALHTHQEHPHVHLVVKAEGWDGRRLHIDKAMLRNWRAQFAQLMRDQGVAANATPRAVRGHSMGKLRPATYQAARHNGSTVLRARVRGIADELTKGRVIQDPARNGLLATRKAVVEGWSRVAEVLDEQGQIVLAGDVRYFASHLPKVMTDRERLAEEFLQFLKTQPSKKPGREARERADERTR